MIKIPVCIPFYDGDAPMAARILKWIDTLGGAEERDLFLVTDGHASLESKRLVEKFIGSKWSDAFMVETPFKRPDERWPIGPNWLFETALRGIQDKPFLWLEPDAIPLKKEWMDLIDEEYSVCGKPFMGAYVDVPYEQIADHMSGIAVYPAGAINILERYLTTDGQAFDVSIAMAVMPLMHKTKLIQHVWGEMHSPPTFAPGMSSSLDIKNISKDAVIFHRNKDGTLLDALGAPGISESGAINIVMPISKRSVDNALMTLRLMALLGQTGSPLVIVAASDLTKMAVDEIRILAQRSFISPRVIHCKKGDSASVVAVQYAESTWKGAYWIHYPDFAPLSKDWIKGVKEQPEGFMQHDPGSRFRTQKDLEKISDKAFIFSGCMDSSLQKLLIDIIETTE